MPKPKQAGLSLGGLILVVAVVLLARALGIDLTPSDDPDAGAPVSEPSTRTTAPPPTQTSDATSPESLFRDERSGVMTTARGRVVKTLPDDNDGSRHQRFLVELPSGHTVLIAHNIDLADRVPLDEGDTVTIRGQYEWSDKGGTIHWTHHDPGNRREGGWIEHAGERYE